MIWVADFTYISLRSEFVYLATILDASSRRCVGWNVSTRMDTNVALGALEEALAPREVKPGLIHHADRGVQYASSAYTERLLSVGVQISMSAKGNAYDNAKAESFFTTLKQEEIYLKQYQTFEEASANSGQFIEDVLKPFARNGSKRRQMIANALYFFHEGKSVCKTASNELEYCTSLVASGAERLVEQLEARDGQA